MADAAWGMPSTPVSAVGTRDMLPQMATQPQPPTQPTNFHGDKGYSQRPHMSFGVGNKLLAGKTRSRHVNQPGGGTRRKKKRTETFALYIYKVLKSIHTETGIGRKSMSIMNSFINDIFDRLCVEAIRLLVVTKKKTLTKHEIRTASKLIIPGELFRHAHEEATTAVAKFESTKEG